MCEGHLLGNQNDSIRLKRKGSSSHTCIVHLSKLKLIHIRIWWYLALLTSVLFEILAHLGILFELGSVSLCSAVQILSGIMFVRGYTCMLSGFCVWVIFHCWASLNRQDMSSQGLHSQPLKRVAETVLLPWRWVHSRRTLPTCAVLCCAALSCYAHHAKPLSHRSLS